MGLLFCIIILILSFVILAYLFIFISIKINIKWFSIPPQEGKFADSHGKKIYYRVRGKGEPTIVVINNIGSSQAEWWHIQDKLESKYRVITWDRVGYGWSTTENTPRTAESISDELDIILKFERIKKPVLLVANGTGTIYALHYAVTRPQNVVGAVFINPTPLQYSVWIKNINESDDFPNFFELAMKKKTYAAKGLFRLVSPIKGYSVGKRYKRYIVEHYTRVENYGTMQSELSQLLNNADELGKLEKFPPIPIKIINSSNEFLIRDWVRNGSTEYSARQLGRLYHELSKDILKLSPKTDLIEVDGSGEHIHLKKPDIIVNEIIKMLERKQKAVHC